MKEFDHDLTNKIWKSITNFSFESAHTFFGGPKKQKITRALFKEAMEIAQMKAYINLSEYIMQLYENPNSTKELIVGETFILRIKLWNKYADTKPGLAKIPEDDIDVLTQHKVDLQKLYTDGRMAKYLQEREKEDL